MGSDAGKRRKRARKAATTEPLDESGLHFVGWDGVGLMVPGDWDLGFVKGNRKNGYLRIDDPEHSRVEVKWRKLVRETDPERYINRYIQELKQRAARRKADLKIARDESFEAEAAFGFPARLRAFRWSSEVEALGGILQCGECGRVSHLQFVLDGGFPYEHARRLLETYIDHPDSGWAGWGLFDFEFEVPGEWVLENHDLRAGLIQVRFSQGRRRLVVRRIGLANLVLKEATLSEWVRDQFARSGGPEYRGLEVIPAQGPVGETVRFRGRAPMRIRLKAASRRQVLGLAWHCRECNRIYAVALEGAEAEESQLEQVAERMYCHQADEAAE